MPSAKFPANVQCLPQCFMRTNFCLVSTFQYSIHKLPKCQMPSAQCITTSAQCAFPIQSADYSIYNAQCVLPSYDSRLMHRSQCRTPCNMLTTQYTIPKAQSPMPHDNIVPNAQCLISYPTCRLFLTLCQMRSAQWVTNA